MANTGCFAQEGFAQANFIQPCVPSGGGAGVGAGARRRQLSLYQRQKNVWDEHQKRQQELLRRKVLESDKQPAPQEQPKPLQAGQPAALVALVTPVVPLVDIAADEQRRQRQIKDRQRQIDEMKRQAEEAAARQLKLDNDAAAFMLLLD
jgi:hypothetical protein